MRSSGILLPVASLPSKYGIGCFSKEAYAFADQLHRAGQTIWQILPLGPTGYGDSPYQSASTFAGNPFLIDLETLIKEELLTEEECDSYDFGRAHMYVNYERVRESRDVLLKNAFERFVPDEDFEDFCAEQSFWLEDYALYMAIKEKKEGKGWTEWDVKLQERDPDTILESAKELESEIQYYRFQQFKFYEQWEKLKTYVNDLGIQIIGDIPIYVSFDSADAWANPQLFQFDEDRKPLGVAGCPPDYFSPTGQLWGNPLYDWEYHKKTGYVWWTQRMKHSLQLYDIVRIDHFRGFDEYYSIPYGDETAEFGHWEKGPGLEFFEILKTRLEDLNVIAEDLGTLTESVLQLVKDTGYPGMKVLEFAFDSDAKNLYLPHNIIPNSIVYTGTHDNDTLAGWIESMPDKIYEYVKKYLNYTGDDEEELVWTMIRMAMSSVADRAIIPMQDYLCLGTEARINTPSTLGDNWKWRLMEGQFTDGLAEKIKEMTKLYGRMSES